MLYATSISRSPLRWLRVPGGIAARPEQHSLPGRRHAAGPCRAKTPGYPSSSGSGFSERKGAKAKPPKRAPSGDSPKQARQPVSKETLITKPIAIKKGDNLSADEAAATPRWGTFCNHLAGEWVGCYGAYTPWEGKPEPVWLDEKGDYLRVAYVRSLEDRRATLEAADGGGGDGAEAADQLVRLTGRASSAAGLAALDLPSAYARQLAREAAQRQQSGSSSAAVSEPRPGDVEVDTISFNAAGTVVFDGGSYSAGPQLIGYSAAAMAAFEGVPAGEEEAALARSELTFEDLAALEEVLTGEKGKVEELKEFRESLWEEGAEDVEAVKAAFARRDDDDEDEEEEEEEEGAPVVSASTAVVEQCLTWGGRERMRLKLTLSVGQPAREELDVELKRMVLFKESWAGLGAVAAGGSPQAAEGREASASAQPQGEEQGAAAGVGSFKLPPALAAGPPCTELPRAQPWQLEGDWKVFSLESIPVYEEDPETGQEQCVWVYSSCEQAQNWRVPGAAAADAEGDGGTFWLPGNVAVTLSMVAQPGGGQGAAASSSGRSGTNGNGNGAGRGDDGQPLPRGFFISFAWLVRDDTCMIIDRHYSGLGELVEVRHSTAIRKQPASPPRPAAAQAAAGGSPLQNKPAGAGSGKPGGGGGSSSKKKGTSKKK